MSVMVNLIARIDCWEKQYGAPGSKGECAVVQPNGPHTRPDRKAPLLVKPSWPTHSLENLCYILWELRVRASDLAE